MKRAAGRLFFLLHTGWVHHEDPLYEYFRIIKNNMEKKGL